MGGLLGKSDEQATAEYFEGKVVWVTGASGGLGEALCVALCKGAALKGLILSARSQGELERVERQCQALRPGVKTKVLVLDLAELDLLPGQVKDAQQAFGCVDVLVNNGGRGFRDLAKDTPLDVDRMLMNVNYFSGVALVKGLLDAWLERGSGHVVQVSSVQGFFGLPGRTAYSATKHAIVGFYDSLRAEVEDKGVTVTLVAPGYIATNHSKNAASGDGGGYPEGHTSKATRPEVMAPQILGAAGRRQPEFVPAALDARVARMLRCACPSLLFKIMSKRMKKEERLRVNGGRDSASTPLKAD